MGLLNYDRHGSLRRHPFQMAQQCAEGQLSLQLWSDLHHRVATVRRHRQEIGYQCQIGWRVLRNGIEKSLELIEFRRRTVAWLEAGDALELCDEWVEWAVGMVGRAEITHARMRRALQPRQQGLRDARRADDALAREQHDPPLAGPGLIQRRSSTSISSCRPTSGVR